MLSTWVGVMVIVSCALSIYVTIDIALSAIEAKSIGDRWGMGIYLVLLLCVVFVSVTQIILAKSILFS